MTKAITHFAHENKFLSNFYPAEIYFERITYPSVEYAYQAAKTFSVEDRLNIKKAHLPAIAKHLGRKVELREDWEEVKLVLMKRFLLEKFSASPLKEKLLSTGDAELIEVNTWGDTFWGQHPEGTGLNHLGRLLMEVRRGLVE